MKTITHTRTGPYYLFLMAVFAITLTILPATLYAQTLPELKAQLKALVDAQKFTDALPIAEKIAAAEPNDALTQFYLGFSLIGQGANTPDADARRALRIRAREAFIKSVKLGNDTQFAKGMAEGIPADGSDPTGYSDNADANEQMTKGEAAFSSGKLQDALKFYQEALRLDPRIYYAALYSGDVYMHLEKYADAEIWFQKAIMIDPYTETAYRYSATPLMKQQKYDIARDRYIEAFIVEPYNRLALSGILGWGQITNTPLSHPRIDLPEFTVDESGKSKSTLNVDPTADDGSIAWAAYIATRSIWRSELFAKRYPAETTYRHTLEEEADALRSVVKAARETKPKNLNPQIATLAKLDDDGFLEAFILMAIPDKGIAMDHYSYLRKNRDKLRQYVAKYVVGAGRKQ